MEQEDKEYKGYVYVSTTEIIKLDNGEYKVMQSITQSRTDDLTGDWDTRAAKAEEVGKDKQIVMQSTLKSLVAYLDSVGYDLFNVNAEEEKPLLN